MTESKVPDIDLVAYVEEAGARLERERKTKEQKQFESDICEGIRKYLVPAIEAEIAELAEKTPGTKKAHLRAAEKLRKFCVERDVTPFPTRPEFVCWLLFHEVEENGAGIATIEKLVDAISYMHRLRNAYDCTQDILVRTTLKHLIKKNQKQKESKSTASEKPADAVSKTNGLTNAALEGAEYSN